MNLAILTNLDHHTGKPWLSPLVDQGGSLNVFASVQALNQLENELSDDEKGGVDKGRHGDHKWWVTSL